MMDIGSADPIITVTLEPSGDADLSLANLDPATRNLLFNGGPLTGINKSSTSSKNFWIEMPQMIVVETRFITQQIATQNHIYSAQTLLPIIDNRNASIIGKTFSQISTQTAAPPVLVEAGSLVKPDVADVSVITESPNPLRDRAVQTTTKTTKQATTIGIQCNLEDDLAFAEIHSSNAETGENKLFEKEEFLTFSREKSIFYLNGRRECMVCGEIEISMDRMISHLALHWGPPALCHICGLKFENQILMSTHRCKTDKRQGKSKTQRKTYTQCPIFWCGSVTSSRHALDEHLRHHHSRIQRRRACVTFTLDRTLVLIRPLNTKLNSSHRCNICLQLCKNSTRFVKHRKRCVASFTARLKRQSFFLTTDI